MCIRNTTSGAGSFACRADAQGGKAPTPLLPRVALAKRGRDRPKVGGGAHRGPPQAAASEGGHGGMRFSDAPRDAMLADTGWRRRGRAPRELRIVGSRQRWNLQHCRSPPEGEKRKAGYVLLVDNDAIGSRRQRAIDLRQSEHLGKCQRRLLAPCRHRCPLALPLCRVCIRSAPTSRVRLIASLTRPTEAEHSSPRAHRSMYCSHIGANNCDKRAE